MDETTEQIIGKAQVVTVKPGDRVLLVMRHPFTEQNIDEWDALLGERFPGVTFTFMYGVESVVHQPARCRCGRVSCVCDHCHGDPPLGHMCPRCGAGTPKAVDHG